jgi:N-acetylglucosaminyl-diphospho-decaprenol L-rhamnosyltransferase
LKLAVVVVSFNNEDTIARLAGELLASLGEGDSALVIDNASSDATAERARAAGLRVIEAPVNAGFGAGCRLGAEASDAPLLLFLNPDARIGAEALERLRAVASEQPDWAAWQPAVMLPDGRINSAGGTVHYLGLSWAGRCGRPAAELAATPYETPFASGAALVVRREAWDALGGFDDSYFLYGEDLELGLRLWLGGERVGVEPRARVAHDYQFDKGAQKWFLLERNRWRTLIAAYPAALLLLLAPALAAAEVGLLVIAARGGWLRAKLRADAAVIAGLGPALRRRRLVQARRRVGAREFAAILSSSLDSPNLPHLSRALAIAQGAYFALVRGVLRLAAGSAVSIARSDGRRRPGQREAP